MTSGNIKVAISSEFMNAFAAIPKNVQGKVLEFISRFRHNPLSPGINYEKIGMCKDPSLRSVRIDKNYRGIVKKPDKGNVYMLLWVDHHDKAYEWAKNKKCRINPETGSLQIYEIDESEQPIIREEKERTEEKKSGLFENIHDRHLLKFGVPMELLPLVNRIETEKELDQAAERLPSEAGEALYALASGYELDEVYRELNKTVEVKQTIDVEDYESALENPDTRRRFFVAEDDLALQEILEAPLEKWRVFLHPSQQNLVERDWNGPVRVLGGAGTGKTVVAMHRAKWLVENVYTNEHEKILFTTFTRNLAADIRENLTKICSSSHMRRIEIINLDQWVGAFLRKNNYPNEIDYGSKTKLLWEKALSMAPVELNMDENFYRDEWERVIQPQGITTFNEYLKASRVGRGVGLSRRQRKSVWPVFEEYRLLLNENNLREVDDAMREARHILQNKGDILPYKSVIVDEAQDMSAQAFMLIRQMIPNERKNDLFIVGDAHQRIYRHKIILSHCGINIRGRGKKLKINYRTTEENRAWAVNLLKGVDFDDLDGDLDEQEGYKSLIRGVSPIVEKRDSFESEMNFILEYLHRIEQEGEDLKKICLVTRTHKLLDQYAATLKDNNKEVCFIHRSEPEDRTKQGIRLATMHRVKGLEFERVIIAGVNDAIVPMENVLNKTNDSVIRKENETRERALLYVSATRARKEVIVTCSGTPSRFLS